MYVCHIIQIMASPGIHKLKHMVRNFKRLMISAAAKIEIRHLNPIWTRIKTRCRDRKMRIQELQQALEAMTAERDEALSQGWTKEMQHNTERL